MNGCGRYKKLHCTFKISIVINDCINKDEAKINRCIAGDKKWDKRDIGFKGEAYIKVR